MATVYKKGKTFTVSYRLKGDRRRYVSGLKTVGVATKVKANKELQEQLSKAGLLPVDRDGNAFDSASSKAIAEHIEEFETFVVSSGSGKRHAAQQAGRVRRLLSRAGIRTVQDIALEPIQNQLAQLRDERCGARTRNAIRQAVVQFERFLVRTRKAR